MKALKTYKKPTSTKKTKRLLPLLGTIVIVFKFFGKYSPRGKKIQCTSTSYNVSGNIDKMIKNAFFSAEAKYLYWVQETKGKLTFIVNFSESIKDEQLYDDVVVDDYYILYYEYEEKIKRVKRGNKYYSNIYRRGKLASVVPEKTLTKKRIKRNEFVQGVEEEDLDLKTTRRPVPERQQQKYVKIRNTINKDEVS